MQSHDLNQCWVIINWTLRNKFQWNFNQNMKLFIYENASENIVCEMAAIFSWWRWVEWLLLVTGRCPWKVKIVSSFSYEFHKTDHKIVVMVTASSSLVALEAVTLTTSNATSDDEAVTMTTTLLSRSPTQTRYVRVAVFSTYIKFAICPLVTAVSTVICLTLGHSQNPGQAPGPLQLFWQHWGFDLIF